MIIFNSFFIILFFISTFECFNSRGFGFITFTDPASVDKVLAQEQHELDGKKVDICFALFKHKLNFKASAIIMNRCIKKGKNEKKNLIGLRVIIKGKICVGNEVSSFFFFSFEQIKMLNTSG